MSYPTKPQTNPRYKNFCQEYYTAGDEEQFQAERDFSDPKKVINIENDRYIFDIWEGNSKLSGDYVTTTFRYIFNKFKKGLYIRIQDNKLTTFLPFSKSKFFNEWSHNIHIDPKYKTTVEFMRHINTLEKRNFNENRVNRFTNEWYANNCLLRYEFPITEGDTGISHIRSMLEDLCKSRQLPDIELFINRRDFPLLKRDYTESYNHLWDSETHSLVSHAYKKYFPILSSVTSDMYADLPMPTIDDWARVKSLENIFFPKTDTQNYKGNFSIPWEEKKNIAVFRGGSTGCGVSIDTNPRLKVAYISYMSTPEDCIDAGITEWNLRPRKISGEKYLKTIEIETLPFRLVNKLSAQEQSAYKYIIHIDGHVSAFRLSIEMNMGCTILMVDSIYRLWYKNMLKPYVHYVPVKGDLSDLLEKIKWCKSHDSECKKMADTCKAFYVTYLSKDGILDYMQSLFSHLATAIGNYTYAPNPIHNQIILETRTLPVVPINKKIIRELARTKTSIITEYENNIVTKTVIDPKKMKENIHEVFIGVNELNYVCEYIPNFSKIYGITPLYEVICQKIDGVSFTDWLQGSDFNFTDLMCILKQIVLALEVAQKHCGFVHYDLFPWNIIIIKLPRLIAFEYIISHDKVFPMTTYIVPIIIDYGKSHVIHKGEHFGFINMFNFDFIQDVKSIFISCISILLKCHRQIDDHFIIKSLQFFNKDITTYTLARKFLSENSSFVNIIMISSKEETRTPIDFFEYMWKDVPKQTQMICTPKEKYTKKFKKYIFEDRAREYYFYQLASKYWKPDGKKLSTSFKMVDALDNYPSIFFTHEIVHNQSQLQEIFNSYEDVHDWSDLKEILEFILTYRGECEVSEEDRCTIYKMYEKILCTKTQVLKKYIADKNTLRRYIK